MQFTRHPIVETIITPKEGFRLQVKSPTREFSVDALELVLYGTTPFYRSCEVSQPFLIPAADFEITQVREARAPLKHATYERAKTGREAPSRESKRPAPSPQSAPKEREEIKSPGEGEGNWERRRRPRRRHISEESARSTQISPQKEAVEERQQPPKSPEPESTARQMSTAYDMVPPPTTLVADAIEQRARRPQAPRQSVDTRDSQAQASSLAAVEAILQGENLPSTDQSEVNQESDSSKS